MARRRKTGDEKFDVLVESNRRLHRRAQQAESKLRQKEKELESLRAQLKSMDEKIQKIRELARSARKVQLQLPAALSEAPLVTH